MVQAEMATVMPASRPRPTVAGGRRLTLATSPVVDELQCRVDFLAGFAAQ